MSGFGTGIGWLGVGAETVERTFSFVDLAGFAADPGRYFASAGREGV